MKKYLIKRVLTTNLALLFLVSVHAQESLPYDNPAYGPDSASRLRCAADLSTMAEFIKIKLYDYALPSWRNVFNECPGASKNIYISGVKIFRDKIEKSSDPDEKAAYFDTLMMNYDRRIQYFGDEGYVLGRKGIDIIRYNDSEYDKAYQAFRRSAELSGDETDLNVIMGLAQTGAVMMKAGKISQTEFLNNYLESREMLNRLREKGGSLSRINRVSDMIDKVVTGAGITDCGSVEQVFTPSVNSAGADPALLELTSDLLMKAGCDNSEFYANVSRKLFETSPNAERAYELARYELVNSRFENAAGFLEKAIAVANDPAEKANFQYQLALVYVSKLGKYQEAKQLATEAIANRPGWGEPYFLLANAVISGIGECSSESFDQKAVYWLAVDYCNKAKKIDPSSSQKADELIARYTAYFPGVEEAFFHSLKEGDSYGFGCWINDTTTVKGK